MPLNNTNILPTTTSPQESQPANASPPVNQAPAIDPAL